MNGYLLASDKARSDFLDYVNELSLHSTENESISEITRRESDAYDEPTEEQKQDDDDDTAEKRMFGRACAQIVSRITNSSRKGVWYLLNDGVFFFCFSTIIIIIVVIIIRFIKRLTYTIYSF